MPVTMFKNAPKPTPLSAKPYLIITFIVIAMGDWEDAIFISPSSVTLAST